MQFDKEKGIRCRRSKNGKRYTNPTPTPPR
jgi:hypothetical protein